MLQKLIDYANQKLSLKNFKRKERNVEKKKRKDKRKMSKVTKLINFNLM